MGEPRVKVSHLRQKHVSIGYVLVRPCKTVIEILFEFFKMMKMIFLFLKTIYLFQNNAVKPTTFPKNVWVCVWEKKMLQL